MRGRDAENDAPEKPPGAEDGGQGHTTNTTTMVNVTVINFEAATLYKLRRGYFV